MPAYLTLVIPLVGTPYFRDCVDQGLLLPNVRLRALDGVTVIMRETLSMRSCASRAICRACAAIAGGSCVR